MFDLIRYILFENIIYNKCYTHRITSFLNCIVKATCGGSGTHTPFPIGNIFPNVLEVGKQLYRSAHYI